MSKIGSGREKIQRTWPEVLWDAKKVRDGNWAASDVRSQVLHFFKKEKGLDGITVSIFVLVISQMLSTQYQIWFCDSDLVLYLDYSSIHQELPIHIVSLKKLCCYIHLMYKIFVDMENTQEIDFWKARIAGLGTTKWSQNTKSPFEVQLVQWLKKIIKNKIEEKNHPLTSSRSSGSLRPHLSYDIVDFKRIWFLAQNDLKHPLRFQNHLKFVLLETRVFNWGSSTVDLWHLLQSWEHLVVLFWKHLFKPLWINRRKYISFIIHAWWLSGEENDDDFKTLMLTRL